jgi:hypothetical protein
MPSGSDKIEEAVSVRDSRPYTALPVAFRHANKHDENCACRTPEEAMTRSVSLLRDFTLRRGDRVMTNEGFRIFLGGAGLAHRPAEFTLLASARDIGEQERGSLRAMERASGFNLPRLATPKPKASDKPVQMTPAPDRVFTRTDGKAVRLVGPQAMLAQSPALAPP